MKCLGCGSWSKCSLSTAGCFDHLKRLAAYGVPCCHLFLALSVNRAAADRNQAGQQLRRWLGNIQMVWIPDPGDKVLSNASYVWSCDKYSISLTPTRLHLSRGNSQCTPGEGIYCNSLTEKLRELGVRRGSRKGEFKEMEKEEVQNNPHPK